MGKEAIRLKRFEIPFMMKLTSGLMLRLSPSFRERMRRFSGIAVLERA